MSVGDIESKTNVVKTEKNSPVKANPAIEFDLFGEIFLCIKTLKKVKIGINILMSSLVKSTLKVKIKDKERIKKGTIANSNISLFCVINLLLYIF